MLSLAVACDMLVSSTVIAAPVHSGAFLCVQFVKERMECVVPYTYYNIRPFYWAAARLRCEIPKTIDATNDFQKPNFGFARIDIGLQRGW